ncbi:cysteine--tRNA ligase [Arcobacter sp. FWKO B]|uniref:cysteine--tRNA ligase n=1 Tax=Arcobacter sp. FWKO B TaxID=2593672 RepID=UPI0018A393A3|nr:cysteine--tRNA ligase [Arcobacter sp. FWKO B]QOG12675.1 cysteine--tRNA ligase [Arcobacter sp. FWKO B]
MKPLYIYDSVKKQKVEFIPMDKNDVKIYICGPTVYDDAHLGHARSAIAFDLLHRVLLANGYSVTMAKNITDIDDKIIKKMDDTKQTLENITSLYTTSYKNDMNSLNILPNTIEPYATKNIEPMIDMINELLKKDIAYIIDDGVYFDVSKDSSYGSLSCKCEDDSQNISRIEQKQDKRNQKDFALWKFSKDGVKYEAPFGEGRPGWHIECSAMIAKHLSGNGEYHIDIHCGGADLLFPHHENEAAQTRCATNKELSKYWMHNGFVTINGEKMSKSLGNSFFVKDVLKSYHSEVIRFYMMSVHYRNDLSFNEIDLLSSKKRLDKIYRLKKRVLLSSDDEVKYEDSSIYLSLLEALNDDLNISVALSIVDEYISSINDSLDKKIKPNKHEITASFKIISDILGIGISDAYEYFQFGVSDDEKVKIEELISQRAVAKKEKDFSKADTIREELKNMSISIMDTPNGTVWEKE